MPEATDHTDASLLRALADPTRLGIVRQLAFEGLTCQCDLEACCDIAQPTVSHHMRILRQVGLVTAERRGTWIYYALAPPAVRRIQDLLNGFMPALRRSDEAP